MLTQPISPLRRSAGLAPTLTILLASLALPSSRAFSTLEAVQAQGVLRMATVSGAATYYEDGKGPNGFEYLLAKAFADRLGVRLEVHVNDSRGQIYTLLRNSAVDFAAAGLIAKPRHWRSLQFSIPYDSVEQKLFSPLARVRPQSIDDLPDDSIILLADGLQSDSLAELQRNKPHQHWKVLSGVESADLMRRIQDGGDNYAVVDSAAYAANRSLFPKTRPAFSLTPPEPIGWAFPRCGDDSLVQAANTFLDEYKNNGELQRLKDMFFDHERELNTDLIDDFIGEVTGTLPKYQELFTAVAQEYDTDWHLLAAIAFQESRWDPAAVSPTGARGFMMLTSVTAQEVGVTNRHDMIQSLRGGAKYFLKLRTRIPAAIKEPDRTWLALAAYNVGWGHVQDARVLARRYGKNPNRWQDVKRYLRLLAEKRHHDTVKHGFARGGQSVAFVHRIRRYQDLLRWHNDLPPKKPLYSVSGLPLEQITTDFGRAASAL